MHAMCADGSLCCPATCKVPTIVPEARAALTAGCAVVLGIQSTGEVIKPHAERLLLCLLVMAMSVNQGSKYNSCICCCHPLKRAGCVPGLLSGGCGCDEAEPGR